MNPRAVSGTSILSSTILLTISSGTNPPDCMIPITAFPKSSPAAILSRSISPVEMWASPRDCRSNLACVPFPEPGGPNKIRQGRFVIKGGRRAPPSDAAAPAPDSAGPRSKPFVMPHDQLRLNLVHRVHGHPHHNQ